MNTSFKYLPQSPQFAFIVGITWEDINIQIEMLKNCGEYPPLFYHKISNNTDLISGCIGPSQNISRIVTGMTEIGFSRMDIYSSPYQTAETFGRHNDDEDVLIVQSFGIMCYEFDDGQKVFLNPGDAISIPIGVYHNPIHIGPRITCSFSQ